MRGFARHAQATRPGCCPGAGAADPSPVRLSEYEGRIKGRIHGGPGSDQQRRPRLSAEAPSTSTRHPRDVRPTTPGQHGRPAAADTRLLPPGHSDTAQQCTLGSRIARARGRRPSRQGRRPICLASAPLGRCRPGIAAPRPWEEAAVLPCSARNDRPCCSASPIPWWRRGVRAAVHSCRPASGHDPAAGGGTDRAEGNRCSVSRRLCASAPWSSRVCKPDCGAHGDRDWLGSRSRNPAAIPVTVSRSSSSPAVLASHMRCTGAIRSFRKPLVCSRPLPVAGPCPRCCAGQHFASPQRPGPRTRVLDLVSRV